jgi:hypothetical protein
MTLIKLQEMIRIVYIEEAELKLKRERPGKNVALTKLGLLTGLDTRTLSKLTGKKREPKHLHKLDRFLRDITPESSVLDLWSSHVKYLDPVSNEPLDLNLRGEAPSFESLAKDINLPRGVTINSVLERLEKSDSVKINNENHTVKLLSSRFLPFDKKGFSEALEVGFVTVGYLVDTLVHNLGKDEPKLESFFQRSNWTNRLNTLNSAEFRRVMRQYLSNAEAGAIEVLGNFEENEIGVNQMTAGVSFFYFEEESSIPSME